MRDSRPALAAWQRFCDRLNTLGESLFEPPYPAGESAQVEGIAHLSDQVVCWLAWTTEHADPDRPRFHRQNDLVTQWGGPNYDNVYRHARIDPSHRYRIGGSMHGCDQWLLALRSGFMHTDTWGTLAEVTASELGIGRGDDFEVLLGGPDGIEIPGGVVMASVREYYYDWTDDPPATFYIECLDGGGPAEVDGSDLADRLDEAVSLVESSMQFWNRYQVDARSTRLVNSFDQPVDVAKGLSVARYAFCFWQLDDDEVLVIDTEVPDAEYYSVQVYSLGWFEPVDIDSRLTGRNHTQLHVVDGRVTIELSARDTGTRNWIDTGGRREGLCSLRWFWPADGAAAPAPRTLVSRHADVAETSVDAEARSAEIEARRRHLARRFAT